MTLFYAEIDTREKKIRWVRAGHDPAMVFDPRDDFCLKGDQKDDITLVVVKIK